MEEKIKILLDKINMKENSQEFFSDAKLSKIKVTKRLDNWKIYIEKETLLPIEILEELEEKKYELDEHAKKIEFIFQINHPDNDIYLSYYPLLLKQLKKDLRVLEIYEDCLKIEDDFLVLVT